MTTKDLESYINLVDEAVTVDKTERINSNFECSTTGKTLSNGTGAAEKSLRQEESTDGTNFFVLLFRKKDSRTWATGW